MQCWRAHETNVAVTPRAAHSKTAKSLCHSICPSCSLKLLREIPVDKRWQGDVSSPHVSATLCEQYIILSLLLFPLCGLTFTLVYDYFASSLWMFALRICFMFFVRLVDFWWECNILCPLWRAWIGCVGWQEWRFILLRVWRSRVRLHRWLVRVSGKYFFHKS